MNDYSANNNATPYVVAHGPFAGTTPTASELVEHVDQYTGERFLTWDTHARTRRFLEAFPPALGWQVMVTQEYLGLSMADVHASANGMAVENPAWIFTAELRDASNTLVANASVVQLLNCPMAVEMGQTRARGKLYQHLGLPGRLTAEADVVLEDERPPMTIIKPVVDRERDAAAARAQAQETVAVAAPIEAVTAVPVEPVAEEADAEAVKAIDAPLPTQDAPVEGDFEVDDDPALESVTVTPPAAPVATAAPAAPKAGQIPAGIMNQIRVRAKRAGVEVPEFGTVDHATAFLADLINPANLRKAAGVQP